MQIKLLFINAINPSKEIETRYPPLGIGYLVSSLRKHFGEDAIEFKVIDSNIEQEIVKFKPKLIGISSVSQNYNKAIAYAKIAKKYGLPVICGGVHISMMPQSLSKDMDVGVVGEGESTICDLIELFKTERSFASDDLQKIKGIIYWDNDKISFTERRELISPLDNIPFPARDLFSIRPTSYIFTSRGCPYRCSFCASSRFWGEVRLFSAEYVVNEIQNLIYDFNIKNIVIYDDSFSIDINRIKEIISLLKKRNILGKVSFSGSIRANLVHEEIIRLLKEMGMQALGMGLESGCDGTLKYLKGDNINIRDNENAIRIIRKYGIRIHCGFIIGSPREGKEDILKTYKFIRKNRLSSYTIYILVPFPGTPVWDYARSRGLVSENMDWNKLNVNFEENYKTAIIISETLTREEIYRLYLKFKQYQKWRRIYNLVEKEIKNPLKVPSLLIKKIINRRSKNGLFL